MPTLIAHSNPSLCGPDFPNIDAIGEAFRVHIPHRGYLRPSAVLVPGRKLLLWWPNEASDKWENKISGDGRIVTSRPRKAHPGFDPGRPPEPKADHVAIFFKPKRGALGYGYRFVGVFKFDSEASRRENRHVYVLDGERIDRPSC